MASRIDVSLPDLKARVEAKRKRVEDELGKAMADELTRLQVKTRAGRDVDGKAFKPYTPQYAKRKADAGRNVGTPDLTFSGAMLNALTWSVERSGASKLIGRIFFSDARQVPKAHGNQAKRRFFGLAKEARARIMDRLKKALGQ